MKKKEMQAEIERLSRELLSLQVQVDILAGRVKQQPVFHYDHSQKPWWLTQPTCVSSDFIGPGLWNG